MAGDGRERAGHSSTARVCRLSLYAALILGACGGGGTTVGGLGGVGGPFGVGKGGAGGASACPDLFGPTLQTFSIDISAADWAAMQAEFQTIGQLVDDAFVAHVPVLYPVTFHYGAETVSDAVIHLRGDSSWREAAQYDGGNGKMQFSIEFDQVNRDARFHGVDKIRLDMPRTDPTFLRERIGNTWLRSIGIPAVCATSAKLMVNGVFYGVYVAEDSFGGRLVKEFFPGNSDGDLYDGGWTAKTNELAPNHDRLNMFWDATTPAALTAIVDVPGSVLAWAAEALLNDADGYWGGDHNFFIYDQGAKGYLFFPHDLDSSLDYLERFDSDVITWWSVRDGWPLPIPQHYRIVIGDDALRTEFVGAVRKQLARYDVRQLQTWVDTWHGQIAAAVAADPHRPVDVSAQDFEDAVAFMRDGLAARADYVGKWLACWDSGSGADGDGDGVIWCHDCRDDLASVRPGAAEICGNGIDDDCNAVIDDGC